MDKVTNDSHDMIIWYRFSTVWTLPCLGCEIWNIQREVFTNSLNTYLMPCKDITWRTCYVRCSNLTVNTTSFSFFWVLFYTWLSKIKIFFGGGRALKVRKFDFHRRIVFISRPCRRERAKSSARVRGSGFWSLNLSICVSLLVRRPE